MSQRPIDTSGGRMFVRQSLSPQVHIEYTPVVSSRQGPRIERAHTGNGLVISGPTPKPITFTINNPNQPQRHVISIQPQPRPQFSPQLVQSQIPPRSNTTPIEPSVKPPPQISQQPIRPQISQQRPVPQSSELAKLSLLSFISSFEETKTFNETDLASLGLDLKCEKPLLPMLHSVLSDAPLLDKSCLPIPECYTKANAGDPQEKIGVFSDQTLVFIFETQTGTTMQTLAAEELKKRGFSFDSESGKWRIPSGNEWSVDQWREIDVDAQQAD